MTLFESMVVCHSVKVLSRMSHLAAHLYLGNLKNYGRNEAYFGVFSRLSGVYPLSMANQRP